MSPSPRALLLAALVALAAFVVPIGLVLAAAAVWAGAVAADAWLARGARHAVRHLPTTVARGRPASLHVEVVDRPAGVSVRIRQPRVPDLEVEPAEADGDLHARLVATRRGRYVLPPVVLRATGPLGLGRWDHTVGESAELVSLPDLPAARRMATLVRRGQFRDPGERTRGPLGLGTDFESLRDYAPDDDIRMVNWVASSRHQRPLSNQFREDTEREVMGVVDCGRLMAAPAPTVSGPATRLDLALDALAAVAAVADAVGDRCGALAYDTEVRRRIKPRRANGEQVVRALADLEARPVDSDPDLAFRVLGAKRAVVLVFTDLLEEAAARPLLDAVPVLARRHSVVVVTVTDQEVEAAVTARPETPAQVYAAVVAGEVLAARTRVAAELTRRGALVVDAPPDQLSAACVRAYLGLKARARA